MSLEFHNERVEQIASQVRSFYDRGEPYRIYHGSTNTTRKVNRQAQTIVDTSQLNHVLEVDEHAHTALVEPNVSMEQLVDTTLRSGLLPPVVMEFPAITTGGGFAGGAGESSSFRHGMFHQTINWIEIVLANGEIMQATRHEHKDLFEAATGSCGTFGVVTLLEIRLSKAKSYIELTYHLVGSMEHALQKVEECTADPSIEYLDGIMFALNKGVIISGAAEDIMSNPGRRNPLCHFTRSTDPWYYVHAEEILQRETDRYREVVPIRDYLFRYDRGAFWTGMYAFKYFMTPFNGTTRFWLDDLMRTKTMYHALHKSRMADEFIIQDIAFPYNTVGQFVEYIDTEFGHYPLWLCPLKMEETTPLRPKNRAAFASNARSPGMMMNVGAWFPGPKPYDKFVSANRGMEKKTAEFGGLKWLYAEAYYTQDEFWDIYDKKWYDDLRTKYHANKLPSVYEKVNVDLSKRKPSSEQAWGEWMYEMFTQQWPVRGVYGVLQVLTSREYWSPISPSAKV